MFESLMLRTARNCTQLLPVWLSGSMRVYFAAANAKQRVTSLPYTGDNEWSIVRYPTPLPGIPEGQTPFVSIPASQASANTPRPF